MACVQQKENAAHGALLCMGYSLTFCEPVSQVSITRMQFVRPRPTPLQDGEYETWLKRCPPRTQRAREQEARARGLAVRARFHHASSTPQTRSVPVGTRDRVVPIVSHRFHAHGTRLHRSRHLASACKRSARPPQLPGRPPLSPLRLPWAPPPAPGSKEPPGPIMPEGPSAWLPQ